MLEYLLQESKRYLPYPDCTSTTRALTTNILVTERQEAWE